MSGAKRRTKYRKQVQLDVLDSFPEPADGEEIVEMVVSRGGNLLEVRTPEGQLELCRLPAKFRKVIWVKRGTFMIAKGVTGDIQTANGELGKVKWTVAFVLFPQQVKHLQRIGKWPDIFQQRQPAPLSSQRTTNDTDEPIKTDEDLKQLESSLEASTITTEQQEHESGAADSNMEDEEEEEEDEYYASTDDESDLFQNHNRRGPAVADDSSDDEDDE